MIDDGPLAAHNLENARFMPLSVYVDGRERRCRVCGCTDARACPGGCWWVGADLCSTCAPGHASNTDGGFMAMPGLWIVAAWLLIVAAFLIAALF